MGVRAAPSARPRLLFHPFGAAWRRCRGRSGHRRNTPRTGPGRGQHRRGEHRCTCSGSVRSAIAASRGRSVRRPGSRDSPASGPASAPGRCLNCSAVAAPSAKHRLTADSSATSPGRASSPAAACRISRPRPASRTRAAHRPCVPGRDRHRPRGRSASAAGCGGTGSPGPGLSSGSGSAACV